MNGGSLGWLKNGNPPFDLRQVKQCGAKSRGGNPCKCPAMKNGRCRLHGGKSTGAKTPEGKERARLANYKHGRATLEATAERTASALARRKMKALSFLAR